MPRNAILPRGINVGKAKRVAMADLRELLAANGYADVRTHLNSGNAVLTGAGAEPATHAARIESALAERLGLDSRCVVLTAEHLRVIVDGHPFPDVATNGSRMMAHVLAAAPPVGTFTEKRLGVAVTARNWNTITKLDDLVGGR